LLETPLPSDDEEKRLTPLHTAVEAGQLEMVRLLLQQGVPVDEQCVAVTPLFRAARHGRDEIVKLLLKNGADVNGGVDTTDLGNITPIRAAQLYGHRDTAQLLLEKGAKIDFFSAAGLGWKTFVADCLEENPGLAGFPDKWNFPAIWLAVNTGQAAVVDQLLNAGGTVDGRYGRQGFSALHVAAERGYQDLAICLIKHGMDVNARAHDGKTPLDYALRDGQTEMVQWLRAHGAVE